MAIMRAVHVACFVAAAACSGSKPKPAVGDDGGPRDAATVDLAPRPLGLPDLAAWGWRDRGGQPAFRIAREAEARGDWAKVVETCSQALAADPGNLDAAWLLAVGHAKLGHFDQVLAPLQLAAAGDFGKWGPASLALPGMQPFLATPTGQAWRRRVDDDQALYIAALARSTMVEAGGDLYAFDPEATRWYRITRTNGAVVGAIRFTTSRLAYIARKRDPKSDKRWELGIGLVDVTRGKSSRPVSLGTKGPIVVAHATTGESGVWVGSGGTSKKKKPKLWRRFDDEYRLTALPPKSSRPPGPWLEVKGKTVRYNALPIAGTRGTILLVEDEPGVRSFCAQVLEDAGYAVVEAGSGEEAVERLASIDQSLALVLTDVVMPGMNGRMLAERVRSVRPNVPILYMSGYTDDMVVRTGVVAEGSAFLQKPFTPSGLVTRVRSTALALSPQVKT